MEWNKIKLIFVPSISIYYSRKLQTTTDSKLCTCGHCDVCESYAPDMSESEYELVKGIIVQNLLDRQSRCISIEREPIGQRDCDKWKSYRRGLLTASNFGCVCSARSPPSFSNIVRSILYSKLSDSKEIEHGNANKHKAIRALKLLEGVSVQKCGLFIDEKYCYLGATPDGLIGENAIVEVKCPYSIIGQNIEDAILAGKCTMWKRERKKKDCSQPKILGINTTHKWYYQVQGQLHITRRDLCYFVIWTGDDTPIRLEKIYRDDQFWVDKMETKLTQFYDMALLPELVDPRERRNMPLRRYNKDGNLID